MFASIFPRELRLLKSQVYTPANAAKHGCQVFDEKTGNATHIVEYVLFSEMGQMKCKIDEGDR